VAAESTRRGAYDRYQRRLAPYVFIAPFYILFVAFFLGPILFGLYTSFTEYTGIGAPRFTGLRNYTFMIFVDKSFQRAFVNTAYYVVAYVILVIPVGLLLALAMNNAWLRLKDVFRSVYFIPTWISGVVVAIIFGLLYGQDYGFLNFIVRSLGFEPVYWVTDPIVAKLSITFVMIWRGFGFVMVFFLAGLQAIPRELIEAAMVDGAGRWSGFRHVTLPLLKPMILFVLVTGIIGAWQIFEEPYLITSGGPAEATTSLAMYQYATGYARGRLGYASTIGVALFVIIFIFSYMWLRWFGATREEEAH
jgi:multiple sugar transport system permease protein